MYMYDPEGALPRLVSPRLLSTSLGLASAAVVILGIVPNSLLEWAQRAAQPLVR